MSQSSDISKKIRTHYPLLKKYSTATVFFRSELFLIGFQIGTAYGYDYDIYLDCRPLWNEKELTTPYIWMSLNDVKGHKLDIEWKTSYGTLSKNYETDILKAIERIKIQFGEIIKEEISLTSILDILERVRNNNGSKKHFFDYPNISNKYLESRLAIGLYFENNDLIEQTKETIERVSLRWEKANFSVWHYDSVNDWKTELYARFSDREAFINEIRKNSQLPRISRLNEAHIINDITQESIYLKRPGKFNLFIDNISYKLRSRRFRKINL